MRVIVAIRNCHHHRDQGRLDAGHQVVHALPGRVRLRFPRRRGGDEARDAAWRFAAHPEVEQVSYRESSQSVVVHFNRDRSFGDIVATLPTGEVAPPVPLSPARGVDWSRVAVSCLLSLLPLGPVGSVALTLATSLTEELRRGQAAAALPGPALPP